jgi:DNA-binding transcriptional regulator YhcF (GntR family)
VARYQEIADGMRRRIQDGRWPPGSQIPSIAQLQAEYDVPGLNTIRSAQRVLIGEGLLRSEHGVGVFVIAAPPPATGQSSEARLRAELDRITQAATRAAALLEERERAEEAAAAVDDVVPERVRPWAWSTGYHCPDCDSHSGVSRGWVDPDDGPAEDPLDDWCAEQGHQVRTWYGPDPDADQAAAVAVEQWWERHAHAEEAARLLATGTPGDLAAARWHARQVGDLTASMPDELAYRVRVTAELAAAQLGG